MVKSSRVIKLAAIICFALTISILMVIRNSPATGYEASIYTHTPPIVWVVLILSIISGIGIILHQLYTRKEETSNLWIIGLLLVATGMTILFLVGVLRGYAIYGGWGTISHLGSIRSLIASGHFESKNFYPIFHIYIAQLSQVYNITAMKLLGYIPPFFAALFMLFMYLFARSVLLKKGQVILATLAGALVLTTSPNASVFPSPNMEANMLVPLVFFLCVMSLSEDKVWLKSRFRLLFIILIFLFPVFHPVPAFALLVMMLTLWLPVKIYNIWGKKVARSVPSRYAFITPAALLLFVWSITWISSFYEWGSAIRNIYTIITQGGSTHVEDFLSKFTFRSSYGYNMWEQSFRKYVEILVYSILTLASLSILLKKIPHNKNLARLFALYGPLAAYCSAMIIFYKFHLGFNPDRLVFYVLTIAAIFVGFVFYEALESARNTHGKGYLQRLYLSVMVLILVLLPANGVFKTYYSRYILVPSNQTTLTEIKGADWFINNKDTNVALIYSEMLLWRYADLLLRPEEKVKRPDVSHGNYTPLPWHFNYDKQSRLGESYTKDMYMLVVKRDRLIYVETYPEVAEFRFYPRDFDKLEDDPSIDNLYDNGGLDVWHVHPVIRLP